MKSRYESRPLSEKNVALPLFDDVRSFVETDVLSKPVCCLVEPHDYAYKVACVPFIRFIGLALIPTLLALQFT